MHCKILSRYMLVGLVSICLTACTSQSPSSDAANTGGPKRPGTHSAVELQPVTTELKQDSQGRWSLWRGGQPYAIKGAGGEGDLQLLAACGGNSSRLWGVDGNTRRRLDEAQAHGLTMAVGIWLEHIQKGFNYADRQRTEEQFNKVLTAVKEHCRHPAVLIWGLGNEMEGYETGDNADLWRHVNELAKAVKAIDPHHPTMTVIAEITPAKIAAIHQHCPDLDIIGINSYGGCTTLGERYRAAGGSKPYIVTEFGPVGTWEVPKNNIDAIIEPDSAAKANMYRASYEAILADKQLCLGSYAFLWGHKQEGTATWFGMLLPDGKKTNAVDTMSQLWGQPTNAVSAIKNQTPLIEGLSWQGSNEVRPGETATATLQTRDPEGDALQAQWLLMKEADRYVTGGDFQNTPPSFLENVVQSDLNSCQIKLPQTPGLYRLYVEVRDEHSAATANLPIRVAEPAVKADKVAQLPFAVYREANQEMPFVPSGWMGATDAMKMTLDATGAPQAGTTCMKCEFTAAQGWGGVAWQHPASDWGEQPGGFDFSGARKLIFWARGEQGGETIKVGYGILGRDKPYYDTAKAEQEIRLSSEWQRFEFDLSGANLGRIKTPFYWVVAASGSPVTFYLDEIVIE